MSRKLTAGGLLDFGAPPLVFGLHDPAEIVGADPEPALDDDGAERAGEHDLDRRSTASSSSRRRSSGRGSAKPKASRTTFRRSVGTPVASLTSRKVLVDSAVNRSKAGT